MAVEIGIWDLLHMEGPGDLSFLAKMNQSALEESLLMVSDSSDEVSLAFARTTIKIFADSPDTPAALRWFASEVEKQRKFNAKSNTGASK